MVKVGCSKKDSDFRVYSLFPVLMETISSQHEVQVRLFPKRLLISFTTLGLIKVEISKS